MFIMTSQVLLFVAMLLSLFGVIQIYFEVFQIHKVVLFVVISLSASIVLFYLGALFYYKLLFFDGPAFGPKHHLYYFLANGVNIYPSIMLFTSSICIYWFLWKIFGIYQYLLKFGFGAFISNIITYSLFVFFVFIYNVVL